MELIGYLVLAVLVGVRRRDDRRDGDHRPNPERRQT